MTLTLEVTAPGASEFGGARRKTFRAAGGTIGRLGDCDWVLPDDTVSGRHAVIEYRNGAFTIEDRSRNGVCVNSPHNRLQRGQPYRLKPGDCLLIGPYTIRVSLAGAPEEPRDLAEAPHRDPLHGQIDRSRPDPSDPFAGLEPVADEEARGSVDPLELLQVGPARPPEKPRQAPRGSDLDRVSPMQEHYRPPAVEVPSTPAPVPATPRQAAGPFIPADYDPLADIGGESRGYEAHRQRPASTPPGHVPDSPMPLIPADYDPLAEDARDRPQEPSFEAEKAGSLLEESSAEQRVFPSAERRKPEAEDLDVSPSEVASGDVLEQLLGAPSRPTPPTPADARVSARIESEIPTPPPLPARDRLAESHDTPQPGPRAPVPPESPPGPAAHAEPEPLPPPGQPAPSPAVAAPASPLSSDMPALAAILAGAGLDPSAVTPELARSFGEILRVVVDGVMDVLRARHQIKDEFRMRMTHFRPADNNPLKFSANVQDALHNLLVKRNPAYLGPVEAFEDAFEDLRNHQIAMLHGMRVAFEAMLAEFDPDRLEQQFERHAKRGSLLGRASKAQYWDLYRERREALVKDPETSFRKLFGEEFAKAYEEQLARLRQRE